jgi:Pretoxin HINT domain
MPNGGTMVATAPGRTGVLGAPGNPGAVPQQILPSVVRPATGTPENLPRPINGRGNTNEPPEQTPQPQPSPAPTRPGRDGRTGLSNQTQEEFISTYRQMNPTSRMSDAKLQEAYQSGKLINPKTGQLIEPIQPLEPTGNRVLPKPGSPAADDWAAYQADRSGGKPPCFPAGTIVQTPTGDRLIETLQAGELVFAYDFSTQSRVERPIIETHKNWTQNIVNVGTAHGELSATRNHPYWVENEERWLPASRLEKGMTLRLMNGELTQVNAIDIVLTEENTYNFEVEKEHNYFAGKSGILVHNGGGDSTQESSFLQTETFNSEIYTVTDPNTGRVIYVGKTIGGTDGRLIQHINDPKSALYIPKDSPLRQASNFPSNVYDTDVVARGNWTRYETAVWEQHLIDQNGGVDNLRNKINAITPEKFELYGRLHNPCM